jgi:hypothetical protein
MEDEEKFLTKEDIEEEEEEEEDGSGSKLLDIEDREMDQDFSSVCVERR